MALDPTRNRPLAARERGSQRDPSPNSKASELRSEQEWSVDDVQETPAPTKPDQSANIQLAPSAQTSDDTAQAIALFLPLAKGIVASSPTHDLNLLLDFEEQSYEGCRSKPRSVGGRGQRELEGETGQQRKGQRGRQGPRRRSQHVVRGEAQAARGVRNWMGNALNDLLETRKRIDRYGFGDHYLRLSIQKLFYQQLTFLAPYKPIAKAYSYAHLPWLSKDLGSPLSEKELRGA
ncbi:hypothetical protein J7T55_009806 [Diaporthe amygdali]|uniref:uncharacterized protein n=1 Tax=Phomopsis amygdali TaxID=1214568 RepID=UPI0022FE9DFF|nr:uncharacterized protein J7T55_009806 [Diaporthe amygdali]KAJ0116656.1 hypothetical protein J7T55_009806 [Diaporthe amygdali]